MCKTVLIADDHPVYLLGLRTLLQTQAEQYKVIHEAVSVDELVEKLAQQSVDIVITDLSMPGRLHADGLVLIQYLKCHWPGIIIIVVTMITRSGIVNSLSRFGVQAVLNKKTLSADLLQTMKFLISPVVLRKMTDVKSDMAVALSPKETEVLRLLLHGLTVNEISARLKRTKQTVSAQKNSAMRKLGVTSEFELYRYA